VLTRPAGCSEARHSRAFRCHQLSQGGSLTHRSERLFAGGGAQVFYWDVSTGRTIRRFRGHDSAVNSVTFAASDTVLVTGGYDQVRARRSSSSSGGLV
jgi:WD40 repeat protein